MTIAPDTKDWTWVVERPCAQCGFDPGAVTRAALPQRMREAAARWPGLLAGPDVGTRTSPAIWSTLEYAAHVRDVAEVMDRRLGQMLESADPEFANWDQDAAAVEGNYAASDPELVAGQLAIRWERFAAAYAALDGPAWERTGRRSDGASFTAYTLGVYALHDLEHHVVDIAG